MPNQDLSLSHLLVPRGPERPACVEGAPEAAAAQDVIPVVALETTKSGSIIEERLDRILCWVSSSDIAMN